MLKKCITYDYIDAHIRLCPNVLWLCCCFSFAAILMCLSVTLCVLHDFIE